MGKLVAICLALVLAACASEPFVPMPPAFASSNCVHIYKAAREEPTELRLDAISDLFHAGCYQEVITLGTFVRQQRRDKIYNVTAEAGEAFVPEGTFTEYTLESYERAYLSILISMSYLDLGKENDALVELRKSGEEERAFIYNYGTDPVMALITAAIWDHFDPPTARPYWKFVSENKQVSAELRDVASQRIEEIDKDSSQKVAWKIAAIGELPALGWESNFLNSSTEGPYKIIPKSSFPFACSTPSSIVIPTSTWVDKISKKYEPGYHPLMMAKALVRLPVSLAYGAVGTTAGVGVGVAGCGLASQGNNSSSGKLCEASLEAAGLIIGSSVNFVQYTLSPDLRHWKKMPIAIWVLRPQPDEKDLKNCVASTDAEFHSDSALIQ